MVYRLPEPLPWDALAAPLAAAEDALARLDQLLATSPIRHGWCTRTDFADGCASLGLSQTRTDPRLRVGNHTCPACRLRLGAGP